MNRPLPPSALGVALDVDVRPTIGEGGVPFCSEDECPSYDGKRCEKMGFRPGHICEPAVIEMANALRPAAAI